MKELAFIIVISAVLAASIVACGGSTEQQSPCWHGERHEQAGWRGGEQY
jgi:hypothetical protein